MSLPMQNKHPCTLCFTIAQDEENLNYMARKVNEEYTKLGEINMKIIEDMAIGEGGKTDLEKDKN